MARNRSPAGGISSRAARPTAAEVLPMIATVTGLGSGVLHALSGPDHLLALAPHSVRHRRGAWRAGFTWGLGHAAGTLAVAAALFGAFAWVHPAALGAWPDRVAGLSLAVMGALNLRASRSGAAATAAGPRLRALFAVGLVQGVTGAAVLPLLLPAATADALYQALFLAAFAVGSTAAMTLVAFALAAITAAGGLGPRLAARLPAYASAASVAGGLLWIAAA
jgi:hypothetical protein